MEKLEMMMLIHELAKRLEGCSEIIKQLTLLVGTNAKLIEVLSNDKKHMENDIQKLKDKIKRLEK